MSGTNPQNPLLMPLHLDPDGQPLTLEVRMPPGGAATLGVMLKVGASWSVLHQCVVLSATTAQIVLTRDALDAATKELITPEPVPSVTPELWLMLKPGAAHATLEYPSITLEPGGATPGDIPVKTLIQVGGAQLRPYTEAQPDPGLPISSMGPDCMICLLVSPIGRSALVVARDESEEGWDVDELSARPLLVRTGSRAVVTLTRWSSIVDSSRRFGAADVSALEATADVHRIDYWYDGENYFALCDADNPLETPDPDLRLRWNGLGEPSLELNES